MLEPLEVIAVRVHLLVDVALQPLDGRLLVLIVLDLAGVAHRLVVRVERRLLGLGACAEDAVVDMPFVDCHQATRSLPVVPVIHTQPPSPQVLYLPNAVAARTPRRPRRARCALRT